MANELTAQDDDKRKLPHRLQDGRLTPAYEAVLENLRNGYPVSLAIKMAGIKRSTAFAFRAADDTFRQDWDDAYDSGTDNVFVAEATRRAVQGVVVPLLYKGKPVTDAKGNAIEVREFSDRLLEFMLTARRPREFGRKIEVSGPNGEALRIVLSPDEAAL